MLSTGFRMLKNIINRSISILLTIIILTGCGPGADEKLTPTQGTVTPTEPVAPTPALNELVRIEGFSIALADMKREEKITFLDFAITKAADTDSGSQSLRVTLIDDHGNEYNGELNIDLEGASNFVLNALPKGFTYVDTVEINMPRLAPVERVRLGEKGIVFKKIKFGKPHFLKDFGELAITKGQSVPVGKWLSFTMDPIMPMPHHWELPITIENKEYNPLPASVSVALQHSDGTISWIRHESMNIPAISKTSTTLSLPIPCWVEKGPPQPVALMLVYTDEKAQKTMLKMFAISPKDLPPLVGQGPEEIETLFLDAYQLNGGQEVMGDPLNLPHWFAGGDKPKDSHDVLIQTFPAISDFGKSAIIWDKQADAKKAYVLNGMILEKYLSSGGPYHKFEVTDVFLGSPLCEQYQNPVTRYPHIDFEGGYITAVSDYNKYEILPYEIGEILTGTMVIDLSSGKEYSLPIPQSEIYGGIEGSCWSPDGKKVAFAAQADLNRGNDIIIFDLEAQKLDNITARAGIKWWEAGFATPIWSLDGNKIAFWATWHMGRSDSIRYIDLGTLTVNLVAGSIEIGLDAEQPTWSPDGRKIAFYAPAGYGGGKPGIYIIDINTYEVTYLTLGYYPSWSPDGSHIAFINEGALYVLEVESKNILYIIDCESPKCGPYENPSRPICWSPDASKIAFIDQGSEGIFLIDFKSKIGRRVTVGNYSWIDWWAPR